MLGELKGNLAAAPGAANMDERSMTVLNGHQPRWTSGGPEATSILKVWVRG